MCYEPGALAAAARPRAGLRRRRDLLAAAARLASGRVWEALHHRLLDWLGDDGQVDWSRGGHRQRERAGAAWGELVGANPVDRGKPRSGTTC
jgi:hypothetical protein